MKTASYFMSVIFAGFFSSIALVGFRNHEVQQFEIEAKSFIEKENDYNKCKQMLDTIKINNEISEKNFKFVKSKLQELN